MRRVTRLSVFLECLLLFLSLPLLSAASDFRVRYSEGVFTGFLVLRDVGGRASRMVTLPKRFAATG